MQVLYQLSYTPNGILTLSEPFKQPLSVVFSYRTAVKSR